MSLAPINPTCLRHHRLAGFSLIELMISIVIGLLVMTGLATMYASISRTNTEIARANGIIVGGRYAVETLAEDLAHAGFWGGYVPQFDDLVATTAPTDTPAATPNPCLAYASWDAAYHNALIGLPVQVFGEVPTGCSGIITNKQANTDVVVVRRANSCVPGVGLCEADSSSKVYLQTSLCSADASRFVLSNDPTTFVLRPMCAASAPATAPASSPVTEKRKFISNMYYIRNYATTVGDGIPTLMRSSFDLVSGVPAHTAAVALIEGIQGFVVELGSDALSRCATPVNYASAPAKVDPSTCTVNTATPEFNSCPTNRGDGVPEQPYIHCTGAGGCTAAQLVNAVAAKIYVLARSNEATAGYTDTKTYSLGSTTLGPFNDGFKRHVFQMTVRINNVSSRRETP